MKLGRKLQSVANFNLESEVDGSYKFEPNRFNNEKNPTDSESDSRWFKTYIRHQVILVQAPGKIMKNHLIALRLKAWNFFKMGSTLGWFFAAVMSSCSAFFSRGDRDGGRINAGCTVARDIPIAESGLEFGEIPTWLEDRNGEILTWPARIAFISVCMHTLHLYNIHMYTFRYEWFSM